MTSASVYVHFPWCIRKCPYCDFNSHPLKEALPEREYVDALVNDLHAQLETHPVDHIPSVFFGGGTPSLFSADAFAEILQALGSRCTDATEVTMEANPGTTEHQDLGEYRRAGINRVSFGVQSFDNDKLRALGRIHSSDAVYASFELAREAGFDNLNLDLMYGLPDQDPAGAMADLDAAIALAPEHLSWYQLTLEPKTEFARRPPRLPADLLLEAMEDSGYRRLVAAGYERYEVSAYAQPGRECGHNRQYWTFADYLGIGAGAHGKLTLANGVIQRTRKAHQPRVYLKEPTDTVVEAIAPELLRAEFMLNVLRLRDGVALTRFEEATGQPLSALEPVRSGQIEAGLLRDDRIATTERGYQLLDSLVQDYL